MPNMPEKGFFKRMAVYLREMYPLASRFAVAALLYLSVAGLLAKIHGLRLVFLSPLTLLGSWNVFALLLILRLMDELKDRDIDLRLFRDRPLPSGKVKESDIRFSLIVLILFYVSFNLIAGKAFWMALIVLAYSLLMFKYFFIPRILRKYLLFNLASHNPILGLMLVQMVVLFSVQHGLSLKNVRWIPCLLLIAMEWAMFFAWEISRKIRSEQEENEYVTYSQIFGRLGAVAVAGGAQTVTLVIAIYFFRMLSLSWVFLGIVAAGYILVMAGHVRFAAKPSPATSKLKRFAEAYILSVLAAPLLDGFFFG